MIQIAFMIICLLIPRFNDWTMAQTNEGDGANEAGRANE